MVIYSHSRLSTFEQCPFKFKLRYIDEIIPEIEASIEIHLGSIVHKTLEWLYTEVKNGNIPTIDKVIYYYAENWKKDYKNNMLIVKKQFSVKDYFNKGIRFLVDYYTKHKPFNDGTLETEKKITLNLDGAGKFKMRGYIDRLSYNTQTQEYSVHDYKTSNNLPTQEKIDSDRQLALYSIAVKELFGREKNVLLVWHYLAHNTRIHLRKTNEQLDQLKDKTIELIKKVESTINFPPNKTILCRWCEYQTMCSHFKKKHSYFY
jgi:putative RecB family exonuclease